MDRNFGIDLGKLFAGERVSISRAITLVENEQEGSEKLLKEIFARTGRSYRIGITGPPGGGKSTIANRLARWRMFLL